VAKVPDLHHLKREHAIQRRRQQVDTLARWLVILGLVLVVAGLLWPWLSRLGLGRLPGDIVIEREGFTFYLPITTAILVSVLLSLILWLAGR
jgi:hypothetical protein